MFPDENAVRQALAQRTFRPVDELWPGIRRQLITDKARRRRTISWPIVAAALILALSIVRGRSSSERERRDRDAFEVSNVRSLGHPATPIILRPDSRTLIVIVD